MNRFTAFLLVVLLSAACAGSLYSAVDIPVDHPYIQYYGRWDFSNPLAPAHSWPGVYIYAEFEGTSIGVKVNDNYTYFNVFIDGTLATIFKGTSAGEASYTLVSGLEDGNHTILFTKRCETTWTFFTFYGFILDDGKSLLPPQDSPERKVEFIGDSFTSASGNEYTEAGRPPGGDAEYTNIYEGFGPIFARHYGAQYMMTSVSGLGLVLDWQGNVAGNIPDRYDRALLSSAEPKWDYEQWIPNLAVIGLGLNDYSGFGGWDGDMTQEETDLYKFRYHDFIATIRGVYPGVKILAVATHVQWMRDTISEVVDEEEAEGHDDVFYAQYDYYESGYVNEGHPNVATHYHIADALIAAVDSIYDWEAYVDITPPAFVNLPAGPYTAYEAPYPLHVATDSWATARYSTTDQSFDTMENTFPVTGKRDHSAILPCVQGQSYTYYLRAKDIHENAMDSSSVITFTVDTMMAPVHWYDLIYPDGTALWQTGATPLGFGMDDVTPISEVHTAYFRHYFDLQDASLVSDFTAKVRYDDGVAVYVNGHEIGRTNLEDGEIVYDSDALVSKEGSRNFPLDEEDLAILKNGQNILAIEVHQADDGEQDMKLDCRLTIEENTVSSNIIDYGDTWIYSDLGAMPQDETLGSILADVKDEVQVPVTLTLEPNYPNPFNSSTVISFTLDQPSKVSISIFNILGQKVRTLLDHEKLSGAQKVLWQGQDNAGFAVPSGVYFFRLETGQTTLIGKMLMIK